MNDPCHTPHGVLIANDPFSRGLRTLGEQGRRHISIQGQRTRRSVRRRRQCCLSGLHRAGSTRTDRLQNVRRVASFCYTYFEAFQLLSVIAKIWLQRASPNFLRVSTLIMCRLRRSEFIGPVKKELEKLTERGESRNKFSHEFA
jgi:hypothetical protein